MTNGPDDSAAYLRFPAAGAPDAWTVATRGRSGSQRLVEVAPIAADKRVADALGLVPGERVVVRRRLMLVADRPVELVESFYAESLATGTPLAEQRKIKGGAPAVIAALGLVVAYADEEVELDARPTAAEAALLCVGIDERVVRLFRTAYTATDSPIEVTASVMRPAGRTLRHRIMPA